MDVPTSAWAPWAMPTISASLSPWGVCQPALPSTNSQPLSSSFLWESPFSSLGANMNTLALAI